MFIPKYLILIFTLLLPISLLSQVRPGEIEENVENIKAEKTQIESKITIWNLKGNGAFIQKMQLDTLQDEIQIYDPIYKKTITNTYTGNYGGAYLNNNFFSRQYNTNFLFFQTHDAYLLTPRNITYYNSTTPYTFLDYSQSENKNTKNETRFNVLHTRNINPKFNVTFRFDQARSDGQYIEQENTNNFVTLYSSYISDKINFHGGFISNKISNQENGGMKDDNQLSEDIILFNLLDTRSEYKNNYFFASTEYKYGKYSDSTDVEDGDTNNYIPRYGFMHYFEYSNNQRKFIENTTNSDFFRETLLDNSSTNDSVQFNKLTNIFQIQQFEVSDKKTSFGKRAFFGFDIVKAVYMGYLFNMGRIKNYNDIYVGGGIFRTLGKFWNWNFEGRFYLTGYHSGQTELSGIVSKPMVLFKDSLAMMEITGKIENRVSDFFQDDYKSNHLFWHNNFSHEQRMTAGVRFISPKWNLELGANYALINNFIYNDTLGIPAQTKKELLIFSTFVNKKIVFGNFNINTKLLAQKSSSSEFIHLPDFSAFVGMYYKILISKVLYTQIGIDTRYNTKYYADAFDPATGFFYLQNEKEIGNYPYIDAYASLKLKRTRVYFKFINVGSSFLKEGYFTSLHYPMNKRTFRLGVDWKFYD